MLKKGQSQSPSEAWIDWEISQMLLVCVTDAAAAVVVCDRSSLSLVSDQNQRRHMRYLSRSRLKIMIDLLCDNKRRQQHSRLRIRNMSATGFGSGLGFLGRRICARH